MLYITRRELLKCLGCAASASLLSKFSPSYAFAEQPSSCSQNRYQIIVNLSGGLDVLELLSWVSGTDAAAKINLVRPHLALNLNPSTAKLVHSLGVALHPSWSPLYNYFDNGQLKFIFGYGNPFPSDRPDDLSHEFNSMVQAFGDYHFSGTSNGVLARVREVAGYSQDQVIALGIPATGYGVHHDAQYVPYVAKDITNLTYPDFITELGGNSERTKVLETASRLREAYRSRPHPDGDRPIVEAIVRGLERSDQAISFFSAINAQSVPGTYSNSTLGQSLKGIAKAIQSFETTGGSSCKSRLFFASNNGGEFDTHGDQNNSSTQNTLLTGLLGDLANDLATFAAHMNALNAWDRVLLIGTSEFGRQIAENSSGKGTDHGHGGCGFAFGGRVKGKHPSNDPNGGLIINPDMATHAWHQAFDVPVFVHFQNLFVEAFTWLGVDPDRIYKSDQYVRRSLQLIA